MYSHSNDMLEALMRYGVSGMGIQSFWDYLAVEDGKQWAVIHSIVSMESENPRRDSSDISGKVVMGVG